VHAGVLLVMLVVLLLALQQQLELEQAQGLQEGLLVQPLL
jgi:hypothetical protein